MRAFEYERAQDVSSAVAVIDANPDAVFLGGGTNLIDHMKIGVARPGRLIDVRGLPLDDIVASEETGLRIGATVSNSDLAVHPEIRRRYPALSQAVLAGASGQLRNMATVGGNLLQRTRCAYFTDTASACNKRVVGSGCAALTGSTHNHAILGASEHCVATHPSDMAVALMAFDAVVEYETAAGPGSIALADFYLPVADTPHLETALPRGALITHVTVPPLACAARSKYQKVRERASYAFAIGSIAAAMTVEGGVIREARIALGAVASRPWRARSAEQVLVGAPARADVFESAAEIELAAAEPLPDNAYKVALMRNLMTAVLTELAEEGPR